jgi:hypothetical protein
MKKKTYEAGNSFSCCGNIEVQGGKNMSKVADFYKQAEGDAALGAELTAAVIAETVKVAAKHGVTLSAADFSELDGAELGAVAGGATIFHPPQQSKIR